MSMFSNSQNFTVQGTFTNVGGNYIANQIVNNGKDERIEALLSANFNHEHYYAARHDQNKRKTTDGTCRWLCEDPAFLSWRDDRSHPQSILYIHGPPGSGKSTLCSQAIEPIVISPAIPLLAYYFCDYAQQFKEIEILSMITCQLLERHALAFGDQPALPTSVLFGTSFQLRKCEYLQDMIRLLVCRPLPSPTYFFLDGLDEELDSLTKRWNEALFPVLDFLVELADKFPQYVRLWITTQPRSETRTWLPAKRCHDIDLTPHAQRDIHYYLEKEVPNIPGPSEHDRMHILQGLQKTAEASFIWARLMLEEIQKQTSLKSIKQFLQDGFPQNLTAYYQKMFDRFPQHLRPLASTVFSLIVYSKRPLRFCELWEAAWASASKDKHVFDPDDKPYEAHLTEVFRPFIERVPVVQEHGKPEDKTQEICRLVHSTLKDFLVKHRAVPFIADAQALDGIYICPEVSIDACLSYLSQLRFSRLLHKENSVWVDDNGTHVLQSRFLIYSAKYWDKHLDNLDRPERQDAYFPALLAFVKSPNFWTLIQVQSIWVQSHFSKFYTYGGDGDDDDDNSPTYLRKMFPLWFLQTEEGFVVWQQYRRFLRHWRHFVCCGICSGVSDTVVSPYTGELHHIWTGGLGRRHFLHDRQSSVAAFAVDEGGKQSIPRSFFAASEVTSSGDMIFTAHIRITGLPPDEISLEHVIVNGRLECQIQTWQLGDNAAPVLQKDQTLRIGANTCDLHLYVSDPTNPYSGGDRAPFVAFSSNGSVLRIGTRIFIRGGEEGFRVETGLRMESDRKANYVDEVSLHGKYIAVASRTRLSRKDIDTRLDFLHEGSDEEYLDDGDGGFGTLGAGDAYGGWEEERVYNVVDSDKDSDFHASDDDGVSEGSSIFSGDDLFEDDVESPWAHYHHATYSDEYSDDDEEPGMGGGGGPALYAEIETDSEEEDTEEPMTFGKHWTKTEEELKDWEGLPQYLAGSKLSYSKPQSTLQIFLLASDGSPRLVFKKAFPRRRKIYASPPVFHPSKSLVVWPLGDNEILFVDYTQKKHFTLRLRPSTPFTCHISIQCSFSQCGSYMHIAALEGRKPDSVKDTNPTHDEDDPRNDDLDNQRDPSTPPPPIRLAMLVSTYRLSAKKTTRAAPVLIHRVRIDLKEAQSINTKDLPFGLTWTPEYLYVTMSWKTLQVWRVPLFRRDKATNGVVEAELVGEDANGVVDGKSSNGVDDTQPVMAPEKPVFMPQTCKYRSVRFFPPPPTATTGDAESSEETGGDNSADAVKVPTGKIVVGHEAIFLPLPASKPLPEPEHGCTTKRLEVKFMDKRLSFEPPLVCYVEQEKDLGAWVDSKARTAISQYRGVGMLDRIEGLEKFNPQDDCELEPYYY